MGSRATKSAPPESPRRIFRLRPRIWAGLFLLAGLSLAGHLAWRHYAPLVAQHPQYRIAAESVHITAPPAWIRSDIKAEVLRDAGLVGTLSVLDDWPSQSKRVKDAFEFHPWVASVTQISKRLPSSLEVELVYRRPVAAVESRHESSLALLPIDQEAIRLPDADLTEVERRYLPRISGVAGRPLVGDVWQDARVVGGAALAARLTEVWQTLRLMEIVPSTEPQARGEERFYTFEIITSGGTRIVWGAAPGEEALAGESAFAEKLRRLMDYAAEQGRLDSIDGPALVDVRSNLIVVPRTARKPKDAPAERTRK